MFTWYRRGDEFVRYESRQVSPGVFELTIMTADGSEAIERFADDQALADRQVLLQRELEAQGWTGPHGWNL